MLKTEMYLSIFPVVLALMLVIVIENTEHEHDYEHDRDSSTARLIAAIVLSARAMPLPAISKAVP